MMAKAENSTEISRDFDASRESVFSMWTDSRKLAKWWGPEGVEVVVSEVDPRPGGAIRLDVRDEEGLVYPMTGTYIRIVPPELIVFRSASTGGGIDPRWEALNTVTFEQLGPRRTRVKVLVQVLVCAPEQMQSMVQGFKGGWTQSFERLRRAL